MGQTVTVVPSGGLPVTVSTNGYGLPVTAVPAGGLAVTLVPNGLPVVGSIGGSDVGPNYSVLAFPGRFALTGESMTTIAGYTTTAGAGAFTLSGKSATLVPPVVSYTGPGEITGWGTAYGYWGLRAYNASKIGANCIDVCSNPFGAPTSPVTMVIGANGYLSLANLPGYSPVYISKIYDQSTGGQDLTTSPSNRPQLAANKVGGLPAMYFNSAATLSTASNATALAQPFSVAGIVCSASSATGGIVLTDGGFGLQIFIDRTTSGTIAHYAGSNVVDYTAGAVVDNTFISAISVLDSSGSNLSSMSLNGTITNASSIPNNPGSNGIGISVDKLTFSGVSGGGAPINGYIYEIVIKAGHVSTANQGLLTTNQRAIGTGF
jgi:hypothetical protein